jgi:hypothetical protein
MSLEYVPYALSSIRVSAEFVTAAGPFTVDVASMDLKVYLNVVPTIELKVPLGTEGWTGVPSTGHALLQNINIQTDVNVYVDIALEALDEGLVTNDLPMGRYLIFQGRVLQMAYTCNADESQGRTGAYLQVVAWHWLGQLQTSIFSNFSSLNIDNLNIPPNLNVGNVADTGEFVANVLGAGFFKGRNIVTDLWGNALRPFLVALTDHDRDFDPSQAMASNALMLFEPGPGGYRLGVPLSMSFLGEQLLDTVGGAISDSLTEAFLSKWREAEYQTYWDILVKVICPEFHLMVVPLASSALVVPLTMGLQSPFAVFEPIDYFYFNWRFITPVQPIRGVRLIARPQVNGLFGGQTGNLSQNLLAAVYDNPAMDEGTYFYEFLPAWLSNIIDPSAFGNQAPQDATALNPGATNGTTPSISDLLAPSQAVRDNYAFARYLEKYTAVADPSVLRGRLNFSVAPGSVVDIYLSEESFVSQLVPTIDAIRGVVIEEHHFISNDEGRPTAFSEFTIYGIQTLVDNAVTGSPINPFWQPPPGLPPWSGAPYALPIG